METKQFPLRVVLSVTTGRLLTAPKGEHDNGIGDVYEILSHMTGDNLFTHQLPRAQEVCTPYLLELFPVLNRANNLLRVLDEYLWPSNMTKNQIHAAIDKWLMLAAREMWISADAMFIVPKLPDGIYQHAHPVQELTEMMGGDHGIITVEIPPKEKDK